MMSTTQGRSGQRPLMPKIQVLCFLRPKSVDAEDSVTLRGTACLHDVRSNFLSAEWVLPKQLVGAGRS